MDGLPRHVCIDQHVNSFFALGTCVLLVLCPMPDTLKTVGVFATIHDGSVARLDNILANGAYLLLYNFRDIFPLRESISIEDRFGVSFI